MNSPILLFFCCILAGIALLNLNDHMYSKLFAMNGTRTHVPAHIGDIHLRGYEQRYLFDKDHRQRQLLNTEKAVLLKDFNKETAVPVINGTTSATLPEFFRAMLLNYSHIDETISNKLASTQAVKMLESAVGWEPRSSEFIFPMKMAPYRARGMTGSKDVNGATPYAKLIELYGYAMFEMMDIVISTANDLDFLEHWKHFIEQFNVIIVQNGESTVNLNIPHWVQYELYTRRDMEMALGEYMWILSDDDTSSLRNFGFLVSDKKFIYTIDAGCLPVPDARGRVVNAIEQHFINLHTPATPDYFNTIYDPFRPGADFVRGYPYSRRGGVVTGVSHGLWLGSYDYDAATRLMRDIKERNHRYVDCTVTVAKGQLYSMSATNLAFNRELMGPAMMMGLSSTGKGQPLGGYGDLIAGWAAKVVADHIGFGTKSGAPYIYNNHVENPFQRLQQEYMGLVSWQERLINFFEKVKLSPTSRDAATAYLELANNLDAEFRSVNPYFVRLAESMRVWVKLWALRKQFQLPLVASRSSMMHSSSAASTGTGTGTSLPPQPQEDSTPQPPPAAAAPRCAVFTVAHNEALYVPIWIRYYKRHFDTRDMYILNHYTTDGSLDPKHIPKGITVRNLTGDAAFMPHYYLVEQVELFQQRLLRAGYKCVLFSEIDEFVAANPEKYAEGLKSFIHEFVNNASIDKPRYVKATGYNLVQNVAQQEAELVYSSDIIAQRDYWAPTRLWSKILLSSVALKWAVGFHTAHVYSEVVASSALSAGSLATLSNRDSDLNHPANTTTTLPPTSGTTSGTSTLEASADLILIHLHWADLKHCASREEAKHNASVSNMHKAEYEKGLGSHFAKSFNAHRACVTSEHIQHAAPIPKQWKNVIL